MRNTIATLFLFCGVLSGCSGEIEFGDTDGLPPIADCGKYQWGWTLMVKCVWEDFPNKIPVRYTDGTVLMEDSIYAIDCYKGSNQCSNPETSQIVGRFDFQHDWLKGKDGFSVILPNGYLFNQTASGRYVAVHPKAFQSEEDYSEWLSDDATPPRWIEEDKILLEEAKRRAAIEAEQNRLREIEYAKQAKELAENQKRWEEEAARKEAERQQAEAEHKAAAEAEMAKLQEEYRLEKEREQEAYEVERKKGVPDSLPAISDCYMPNYSRLATFKPATCLWEGAPREIPVVTQQGRIYYSNTNDLTSYVCIKAEMKCKRTRMDSDGIPFSTTPDWSTDSHESFSIEVPPGYILAQTKSGTFIAYHQFAFETNEEAQSYLDSH